MYCKRHHKIDQITYYKLYTFYTISPNCLLVGRIDISQQFSDSDFGTKFGGWVWHLTLSAKELVSKIKDSNLRSAYPLIWIRFKVAVIKLSPIDKVHIFWEGHKILRNLHCRFEFDRYYIGQIYGGDFAKFCGLLRIYELLSLITATLNRIQING